MIEHAAALEGLRVLEVPSPLTSYCGKLLADLGAEVILVEPVGGSPLRRRGAGIDGVPADPSIAFHYHAANKRSVTLDLDTGEGRDVFIALAASASLVLDGSAPGVMDERGLDFARLAESLPGLVVTSVTPFGRTGPYAHYRATDLTALAMGGLLSLGGYVDSSPMRAGAEQAYVAVNIFAAIGSLLAVIAAERTGEGQLVDVSMQEAVCMALENAVQYYEQESFIRRRTGGTQRTAGQGVFACADGYVYVLAGGIAANRFWDPFVAWMHEEHVPGVERLDGPEWRTREHVESDAGKSTFAEVFGTFARGRTKQELYQEAQRRGLPLCPVNSAAEVVDNEQLRARGFFAQYYDDERGLVLEMPGAPYRHSATPWAIRRPAPLLGEANVEYFREIGLDSDQLAAYSTQGII